MKIISVVGARPNFMKIAPFIQAIIQHNTLKTNNSQLITHVLVHSGQHYDDRMSKTFFEELGIPNADINLGIGSGSHALQVGQTMIAFEKVLEVEKPDWVVVVGDVNATLACSVTAKKMNIKVCHIEAGLRSWDESMPEEINRLVTDRLSDLLLTPDTLSSKNLLKEGVAESKVQFVGNIMIDTLESNRTKAEKLLVTEIIEDNLISDQSIAYNTLRSSDILIDQNPFALLTMHRPSNVDQKEILEPIIRFLLDEVNQDMLIIWPIHPRTQNQLKIFGLWKEMIANDKLILLHPLGYHEMLKLNMSAKLMLTDSGGLQEECTILGTPCLTLRWNTERPITLNRNGGASVLVGNNITQIRAGYKSTLTREKTPDRPELWDGKTADRILKAILNASDLN
ncbi:MAG: UDP-2,3-diacetamido-2,3-dideoxy-D-glucuronate 2-epimerase [Owenweeksia sp. TMED14]|nr:MAG: UDP-2,3-diacetamido-2,3-dideoxy-D-glucuronate 2-epimerase [Owenweeksia sp. TMED14]